MLLIGGYTKAGGGLPNGKARGISAYDFFPSDGSLNFLGFTPSINPSYILTDRKRSIVYAVRESNHSEGAGVTAHRISQGKNGKVRFELISDRSISGDDPCHLAFAGSTLLVSSYSSAHVHVFARKEDGSLGEQIQEIQLTSASGRPSRAHCAVYQENNQRVWVCDLGDDKLKCFARSEDGLLTHVPASDLSFPEKSGPRHIALHPAGEFAVVNGEGLGVVHLLDLRGETPWIMNTANALPERVIDEARGAAIRIGANGKMVYASDRNFSVVNSLRIDERAGKLIFRDTFPSGGEHPRDLTVSPNGEWLLTANTADHTVGVFHIDPKGSLVHYHTFRKIPSPTSLAWL